MEKDGRDTIEWSMQPCFYNGPSRSAIQKEKKENILRKVIKSFHGASNFDLTLNKKFDFECRISIVIGCF